MGEELTEAERAAFKAITGRDHEPGQRVNELVAVVGRRGGKSRAMSVLVTRATFSSKARLVWRSASRSTRRVVGIVREHCAAVLEESPILRQLIANRTQETVELTNGISIEVRPASFRKLRGPTYITVIADELAIWYQDSTYSNPDVEILAAVRPGLLTTRGPLILASSPYAKRGVLWDRYRRHYGPEGSPLILVAHGSSRDFNPTLDQAEIERALEEDRPRNTAEYLAQFRSDLEGALRTDDAACEPSADRSAFARINVDEVPGASKIDTVETASTPWTATGANASDIWSRVDVAPFDRAWFGVDFGAVSDTALESPALQVGTSAPFVITFDHRFGFETDTGGVAPFFDGGVIEISRNGGPFEDIATFVDPGYGGALFIGSDNPLGGRQAFVGRNASFPSRDTVSLNLGMAFAGQTVKIRFRIATDAGANDIGWELDNLAFQGITNSPFAAFVADQSRCRGVPKKSQ